MTQKQRRDTAPAVLHASHALSGLSAEDASLSLTATVRISSKTGTPSVLSDRQIERRPSNSFSADIFDLLKQSRNTLEDQDSFHFMMWQNEVNDIPDMKRVHASNR